MADTEAPTITVVAAPPNIKRVSGSIDVALATAIHQMAATNPTGATDGKVYPSRDDAGYKASVASFRKHLASRLDTETQRVKVVPFTAGDGVSFAVQIAARTRRASKSK